MGCILDNLSYMVVCGLKFVFVFLSDVFLYLIGGVVSLYLYGC